MRMKWTSWRKLETSTIFNGPGVYKIRLLIEGNPLTIPRFLGEDRSGLLSIGVSGNLEYRRQQFITGLRKGRRHSEGNLLYLLKRYAALERKVGPCSFHYAFCSSNHRRTAEHLEGKLIKQYVKRYGEVPPLNSAIPDRYNAASWAKGL